MTIDLHQQLLSSLLGIPDHIDLGTCPEQDTTNATAYRINTRTSILEYWSRKDGKWAYSVHNRAVRYAISNDTRPNAYQASWLLQQLKDRDLRHFFMTPTEP
jgi:hypothetical protein